jgi:hypothetical protein
VMVGHAGRQTPVGCANGHGFSARDFDTRQRARRYGAVKLLQNFRVNSRARRMARERREHSYRPFK